MGAISAWIKVLTGFVILAISFLYMQPVFDFLFAIGHGMGGNGAQLADRLQTALQYAPIMVALSLIVYGIFEGTRTEDNRR